VAVTLGVGQFCTNPGVVFVPATPAADSFVAALAAAVDAAEVGPMLDARIAASYAERSAGLAALTGVTVVTSRQPPSADGSRTGWRATPAVLTTDLATWEREAALREECFGPLTVVVRTPVPELVRAATSVPAGLAAALHIGAGGEDDALAEALLPPLTERFGRILFDGFPTGVAVSWAQQHGGPYPATTSPLTTSVGARAIDRFLRPVAFQDVPDRLLPERLRDGNPWRLPRRVDGVLELPGT
jgi:NADP-dependent aldehyde dehydrogenase